MKKKKYYVVWKGAKTGVLSSWDECQKSIKEYKGAKYKSFKTKELAEKAFLDDWENYIGKDIFESTLSKSELEKIGYPNLNSISVDAACSGKTGIMEYQGVETGTKKILFKSEPYLNATNNIGEFLALVHGLAYLKAKGDKRPIYSDSKTAISWVKYKSCNTEMKKNSENQNLFELIGRAEKWLNTNVYVNKIIKWETKAWGEIPADFGRK